MDRISCAWSAGQGARKGRLPYGRASMRLIVARSGRRAPLRFQGVGVGARLSAWGRCWFSVPQPRQVATTGKPTRYSCPRANRRCIRPSRHTPSSLSQRVQRQSEFEEWWAWSSRRRSSSTGLPGARGRELAWSAPLMSGAPLLAGRIGDGQTPQREIKRRWALRRGPNSRAAANRDSGRSPRAIRRRTAAAAGRSRHSPSRRPA